MHTALERDHTKLESARRFRVGLLSKSATFDVLAVLVALFGVLIYAGVSDSVFDRVPHIEDEMSLVYQARTIASGHIRGPIPDGEDFFRVRFVIDGDSYRYGIYPPGFPLLLALGVLIGHPWVINPLLGGITVGLVYLAGARLYGSRGVGLLAAVLLSLSPFLMMQAGSLMAHVAALMWIMVFLLLFDGARRSGRWWLGALAGVAIGMVFLIRPFTAVAAVIPFVVWAIVDLIRRPRRSLAIYVPMAAMGVVAGLTYLAYNQYTTGDPMLTGFQALWEYNRPGFGEDVGRRGHTVGDGLRITRENLEVLSSYLYGWPFHLSYVPVVFGLVVTSAGSGRRLVRWIRGREDEQVDGVTGSERRQVPAESWDLALVTMAALIVVFHIAYWTTGRMYGPRFYFETLGALALLSGRGLFGFLGLFVWGLRSLTSWHVPGRTVGRAVMAILLVTMAGLFVQGHRTFTPGEFERYRDWYGINRDDLERVESAGLSNAVVFVEGDSWTDSADFIAQNDPHLENDVIYARDYGDADPRRLPELFPQREIWVYEDGELRRIYEP